MISPRSVLTARPGEWGRRTTASLAYRDFRVLWFGMLAAFLAMQMQQVAGGYLAYKIAGSATALGVVSLGWGIPMLSFSLFGGVAADRISKRKLMLTTQTVTAIVSVATAFLVFTDEIAVWHLFLGALINGTAMSFNMPTRQALMSEMIPASQLTNAMALSNAGMNMTRILGPAIAGGLIGLHFIGLSGVYFLVSGFYVLVVVSYLFLPDTGPAQRLKHGVLKELRDGLSYVRNHETLLPLMAMAFIAILLGMPVQMLLPVFAEDVFHVGPTGLGLLFAVGGVGALAGSVGIASLTDRSNRRMIQMVAGVAFGLGLSAFALSVNFPLALVTILIVDCASAAYMALNGALIMSTSEHAYRGRVMSIYMMTFSLMPLASLPMSALTDQVGAPAVVAVAGLIIAVAIAAVSLRWGRRMHQPVPAVAGGHQAP